MHLLRTTDNSLEIFSWPGRPTMWSVATGLAPSISGPMVLPGEWETFRGSATPYSGAGIGPDGHVCFVASRGVAGLKPSAIYTQDSAWDFACHAPDGRWTTMTTLPIGLRYCYPYVFPRSGGRWTLLAERDVRWEAAGYTPPPNAFAFMFNQVDRWQFDSTAATAPSLRSEIGRVEPTVGPTPASYVIGDAMYDARDRLHVLTRSRTSAGEWKMRHVLVPQRGAPVSSDVNVPGYTDGSMRLVSDELGRLVLLFTSSERVYALPATDADGSAFGPPVDLSKPFVEQGRTICSPPYVTAPRGGTPDGRDLDLVIDTVDQADRHELYYARISLHQ